MHFNILKANREDADRFSIVDRELNLSDEKLISLHHSLTEDTIAGVHQKIVVYSVESNE